MIEETNDGGEINNYKAINDKGNGTEGQQKLILEEGMEDLNNVVGDKIT